MIKFRSSRSLTRPVWRRKTSGSQASKLPPKQEPPLIHLLPGHLHSHCFVAFFLRSNDLTSLQKPGVKQTIVFIILQPYVLVWLSWRQLFRADARWRFLRFLQRPSGAVATCRFLPRLRCTQGGRRRAARRTWWCPSCRRPPSSPVSRRSEKTRVKRASAKTGREGGVYSPEQFLAPELNIERQAWENVLLGLGLPDIGQPVKRDVNPNTTACRKQPLPSVLGGVSKAFFLYAFGLQHPEQGWMDRMRRSLLQRRLYALFWRSMRFSDGVFFCITPKA